MTPDTARATPVGEPATAAAPAATALLEARHLSKSFPTPDGAVIAVDDFSFGVGAGEFVSIIGPSGCGKSTVFNIIGGLLGDYGGEVVVDGSRISGTHPSIGMVFQEESTFPWRTVLDNVAFPLEIAGVAKAERFDRAAHFVKLVGLNGFERRLPEELSGGMRQRVAIALGDKVLQIQQELQQTTLLITHNLTEAVQLSDRVLIMTYRPGRLKRIVDVNLPHPRDPEVVSSDEFGHCVAAIWHDLREEASRGIADDESRVMRGDGQP